MSAQDTRDWVKLDLSVKPEARDGMRMIAKHYGLSHGQAATRLIAEEVKRLERKGVFRGK